MKLSFQSIDKSWTTPRALKFHGWCIFAFLCLEELKSTNKINLQGVTYVCITYLFTKYWQIHNSPCPQTPAMDLVDYGCGMNRLWGWAGVSSRLGGESKEQAVKRQTAGKLPQQKRRRVSVFLRPPAEWRGVEELSKRVDSRVGAWWLGRCHKQAEFRRGLDLEWNLVWF